MTNENLNLIKESILSDLNKIIGLAKKLNLVVEIKLESKEPLAMDNYEMVPDVRQARESQFQFLSEEKVEEIGVCLNTLKRTAVIAPWIGNTYLLCEKIDGSHTPIGVIKEELYLNKINPSKLESIENVDSNNKSVGC